ncbi:MAG: choice-of-anchor D domain-containing protein [Myxococcales bacterium]|nr:choice-of-anchor D domain-containing protein [Myxococcales bacterium]
MSPRALLVFALGGLLAGCTEDAPPLPTSGLRLDPAQLGFGAVALGTTRSQEVQVINESDATVGLRSIEPAAGSSGAFGFALSRTHLPAKSSAILTVDFTPEVVGTAEAVWSIAVEGAAGPTLSLSGAGVAATGGLELCDEVETLDFGVLQVGGTRVQRFEICNPTLRSIEVTLSAEPNTARCEAATDEAYCLAPVGATLDADGRTTILGQGRLAVDVRFTPHLVGARERGGATFSDCSTSACRHTVRFDGLGSAGPLGCTPSSLNFGDVFPGDCATRNLSCTNLSGGRLTVSGWSAPEPYESEPSRSVQLADGEALDIEVTFCPLSPSTPAPADLTIQLARPAPDDELRVPLTGSTAAGHLVATPDTLSFGQTSMQAPQVRSVLVTNTGLADASIVSILADADGTGSFSGELAPTVLAPGASASIPVTFRPTRTGFVSSRLLVQTDLPGQPELTVRMLGEGVDLPPCTLAVSASALDFGDVLTHRPLTRDLIVSNEGNADCIFYGATLAGGSAPAFQATQDAGLRIAPRERRRVTVEYRPTEAREHEGTLEVAASTGAPPVAIDLHGRGVHEGVLVAPNQVSFGTRAVGCQSEDRSIQLYNTTLQLLTISAVSLQGAGDGFTYSGPALPFTVSAQQSATIGVGFAPSGTVAAQGSLLIEGTLGSAAVRYVVQLRADSDGVGVHEEVFEAAPQEVDILFVLDLSPGMSNDLASLASGLPALLEALDDVRADYHLGVTTADTMLEAGRLVHPLPGRVDAFGGPVDHRVITRGSAGGPEQLFTLATEARPESGGGPTSESPLFALHQALAPARLEVENAGFLRPHAALSVVLVSDEDDQSNLIPGSPNSTLFYYVEMLRALKGFDANQVTAVSVAGPPPAGCNGPNGVASAAPRLVDAALLAMGSTASICSATGLDMLSDVAQVIAQYRLQYRLTAPAVPASIEVSIDGQDLTPGPNGFTYDPGRYVVSISPFVSPLPSSRIVVRYAPECR